MAAITAAMVKELRDKTDAGMMDCKKALAETDGNMEAAVEYLRKNGIAKAGKRSERSTKEGRIYIAADGNKAVMVEVLSETDFVASNEKFQEYVKAAAGRVLAGTTGNGDITAQALEIEKDNIVQLAATLGENIQLRRAVRMETEGKLASYMHMGGKLCVMVEADGEIPADLELTDICMHITVYDPTYICSCEIPAEAVAKERELAAAELAGKPANIIEKILDGKIQKWYTEVCLVNQPWFNDDKTCLAKLAPKMNIKKFIRWKVGQEL